MIAPTALSPTVPPAPASGIVPFGLVGIGASAGGLAPLLDILQRLPADFDIPILVVQHLGVGLRSELPRVLNFRSALPCRWAVDGERPPRGAVLVAPAGANMVLTSERRLARVETRKPPMGWPSADALFHSMATILGPRGVAVVLSGMLRDGADGIAAVRRSGGATLAQLAGTAAFSDMPTAAADLGRADLLMCPARIAEALVLLSEYGVR